MPSSHWRATAEWASLPTWASMNHACVSDAIPEKSPNFLSAKCVGTPPRAPESAGGRESPRSLRCAATCRTSSPHSPLLPPAGAGWGGGRVNGGRSIRRGEAGQRAGGGQPFYRIQEQQLMVLCFIFLVEVNK
eukprot:Hpha_TRINITY_DN14682_c0_g4::TRINITY_DN14682_c0_g4_i1::g.48240::m.48240